MKITYTEIVDVNTINIDETKLSLANRIIKNVRPLFDEVYIDNQEEIKGLINNFHQKKEKISEAKRNLESLVESYNRKIKIKKLLERISKLVSLGLVNDGTLKNEFVVLLKIIEKLPNEKLDYHLQQTMNYINKRFAI